MNLSEYILLPRETRVEHIDLSTPCDLHSRSFWSRNPTWEFFGVVNDVGVLKGKVTRCHCCGSDTTSNLVCINPLHHYIGVPKENTHDIPREHLQRGGFAMKGKLLGVPKSEKHKQNLRKPKPKSTWMCLETGRVFQSHSWISRFQNQHCIDPSLRKQLT